MSFASYEMKKGLFDIKLNKIIHYYTKIASIYIG